MIGLAVDGVQLDAHLTGFFRHSAIQCVLDNIVMI